MTIDELARAVGATVRNVRAYQTRGILPPPTMVGRTGRYGPEHLERLRMVGKLQERGYSLAAIADLVSAWEQRHSLAQLLGLERSRVADSTAPPDPEMTRSELRAHFPAVAEADLDEMLQRATNMEVLEPRGDDRYLVRNPELLQVGAELSASGIPLQAAYAELTRLREEADQMSRRFFALFLDHVWKPWEEAGRPMDRLPELLDALRKLKPLPAAAVVAVLEEALDRRATTMMESEIHKAKASRD